MSAITIRNLPDAAHEALRQIAAGAGRSVESLAREILVRAAGGDRGGIGPGMSEASAAFSAAPQAETDSDFEKLWGALRGTVHVPAGVDLASPLGEAWQADRPG